MEKLITIRTIAELQQLRDHIAASDFLAFDTETTGLDFKDDKIIGFSVSGDVDTGYYVIMRYWDVATGKLIDLFDDNGMDEIVDIFELLAAKPLIMHNAVFDCAMVEAQYRVKLMPAVHTDTMILAHLLNENRHCGLKELALTLFGEESDLEQRIMKESVTKNGGVLTKKKYELYKADADLIARYGAKDTILTLKLFYTLIPDLYDQKLDAFFYQDESMPLLRGPTYELNTIGLRVDPEALTKLKGTLQAECLELEAFVHAEVAPHVKERFPGTTKKNQFNPGSGEQLAWLLFGKLNNDFLRLTDGGRELCYALDLRLPYAPADKRRFIQAVEENFGRVYAEAKYNPKTKKMGRPKKVGVPWKYLKCDKEVLGKLAKKYKWVEALIKYNKNSKLLSTYVEGIQHGQRYNIIRPSFLQHGTTSGRYSSRHPNFQNLPRKDKRVKACIIARPGRVFVGADYSQLEPRVFASVAQDETLLGCFASGDDFYSVVGAPVYDIEGLSLKKDEPNSFSVKHPDLRDNAKIIALATPYGRTAAQQAGAMDISIDESQQLINRYFERYPKVELMMLESHEQAKTHGVVYNLYGRPRRMPEAMDIPKIYGNTPHAQLPYTARNTLNLAMNHRVQSTGASIMNRAAITFWRRMNELNIEARIILQVHDELVVECLETHAEVVHRELKWAMENAVILPGVALVAEPKIGRNLAELK